jgi:hypothetical protein
MGWTKLDSEELNDLCCLLTVEQQWTGVWWEKMKETESFEDLKRI